MDDEVVDAVLCIRCAIGGVEEPTRVRFVFGEEQRRNALAIEMTPAVHHLGDFDERGVRRTVRARRADGRGSFAVHDHRLRNHNVGRTSRSARLRAAVLDCDPDEDVFGGRLRVLHEHVEVPILVEHSGVEQLVLGIESSAARVLIDQGGVRKLCLRILVQKLHVRVRRRAVQIEVILLDVLAVIALVARQPEEALLENRIPPIPEREGEADVLVPIADAAEAVLVPAVDARSGVFVREELPGGAVGAVVLADRPPRPLAQIRTPAFPVGATLGRLVQAGGFGGHRWGSARGHAAPDAPPPAAPALAAPLPPDPPDETNHANEAAASDGSCPMAANHGGTAVGCRLR